MANHKSAIKEHRRSLARRLRNRLHLKRLRTAVKKLRAAIEGGDAALARTLLPTTLSLVDHTATRGVIPRGTAARTKSRLSRALTRMSRPAA